MHPLVVGASLTAAFGTRRTLLGGEPAETVRRLAGGASVAPDLVLLAGGAPHFTLLDGTVSAQRSSSRAP